MKQNRLLWYLLSAGLLAVIGLFGAQAPGAATTLQGNGQQTVPTPEPVPLEFTIQVTLQRPNAPSPHPSWAVPVRFGLYRPGDPNALRYQWDLTLDDSGRWSGVLNLARGVYDVRIKNLHTLRNLRRDVAIYAPITLTLGTLLEGDADDDNRVRASDFTLLRAAYFTTEGDPGFDSRADFDEDNRIRSSDFALLRGNYFATGDIEVTGLTARASGDLDAGSVAVSLLPAVSSVRPGEVFTVTLRAAAGSQPFVALDADIRYPPNVLQVVGPSGQPASEIEPLPGLSTVLTNRADNATGRILYGAGLFEGEASGDVPIARVRFRALRAGYAALVHLADVTVAAPDGRFVTGPLSDAQAVIEGRAIYLPLLIRTF
jgi:hypothetical protein